MSRILLVGVTGSADNMATSVTINGVAADLKGHIWSKEVDLVIGSNEVVVVARLESEADLFRTIRIQRKPAPEDILEKYSLEIKLLRESSNIDALVAGVVPREPVPTSEEEYAEERYRAAFKMVATRLQPELTTDMNRMLNKAGDRDAAIKDLLSFTRHLDALIGGLIGSPEIRYFSR